MVDITKLAEVLLSGSLAFSGIAIGGIALSISAYLVVREAREHYPAKLLKGLLWFLSLALISAIASAGLAFVHIISNVSTNFPDAMWWSAFSMGATLVLSVIGGGILIAFMSLLK